MRPDKVGAAATRRRELTRAKAIQAVRELDRAGAAVIFASVAAAAGICRSWLYTQPDLRGQVQELRNTAAPSGSGGSWPAPSATSGQRGSIPVSINPAERDTIALRRRGSRHRAT
jgi:hypothetical protein